MAFCIGRRQLYDHGGRNSNDSAMRQGRAVITQGLQNCVVEARKDTSVVLLGRGGYTLILAQSFQNTEGTLNLTVYGVPLQQLWALRLRKVLCLFVCFNLVISLLASVWFLDFYFRNEIVYHHNSWSKVWSSNGMVYSFILCLLLDSQADHPPGHGTVKEQLIGISHFVKRLISGYGCLPVRMRASVHQRRLHFPVAISVPEPSSLIITSILKYNTPWEK